MDKLLSIIIPTVNRCEYLKRTVEHLLPQIIRNIDDIEFIICSNSCTDNTSEYVNELKKHNNFIHFYHFDEFVPICDSFSRSIGTSSGKYIILWGDDDLASPFVIDFILYQIKSNPNLGLLHYNVAVGTDLCYDININRVENTRYSKDITREPLKTFLTTHAGTCGFITSMVFLREAWEKGIKYQKKNHYGYEFLYVIYHGLVGKECVYCNYPMVIQRMPMKRAWLNKWPLYGYIGLPTLLHDLDSDGLSIGSFEHWNNTNNSFYSYLIALLYASSDKKFYRPHCKEIALNQRSKIRKMLAYIIIYTFPSFFVNFLRKIFHK